MGRFMDPVWSPPRRRAPGFGPSLLLLACLLQPRAHFSAFSENRLPEPAAMMGISPNPRAAAGTVQAPSGTPFEETRLQVFTLDYPHVQIPFEITLWILLASLAKIGERVPRHYCVPKRRGSKQVLGRGSEIAWSSQL